MRRLPNEATAPGTSNPNEVVFDEAFLQRVDRVMLQRKQTDPFRWEAVWRATEEEARLRHLQLPDEGQDPVRGNPR
ncbi:hypothetical protein [Variovorax sp. Varisp62]|uniref:hypothetical protein n=1 Tax=Variovorax sp. Varisp62 TaxID=3243049 RepID=UPI0039B62973